MVDTPIKLRSQSAETPSTERRKQPKPINAILDVGMSPQSSEADSVNQSPASNQSNVDLDFATLCGHVSLLVDGQKDQQERHEDQQERNEEFEKELTLLKDGQKEFRKELTLLVDDRKDQQERNEEFMKDLKESERCLWVKNKEFMDGMGGSTHHILKTIAEQMKELEEKYSHLELENNTVVGQTKELEEKVSHLELENKTIAGQIKELNEKASQLELELQGVLGQNEKEKASRIGNEKHIHKEQLVHTLIVVITCKVMMSLVQSTVIWDYSDHLTTMGKEILLTKAAHFTSLGRELMGSIADRLRSFAAFLDGSR